MKDQKLSNENVNNNYDENSNLVNIISSHGQGLHKNESQKRKYFPNIHTKYESYDTQGSLNGTTELNRSDSSNLRTKKTNDTLLSDPGLTLSPSPFFAPMVKSKILVNRPRIVIPQKIFPSHQTNSPSGNLVSSHFNQSNRSLRSQDDSISSPTKKDSPSHHQSHSSLGTSITFSTDPHSHSVSDGLSSLESSSSIKHSGRDPTPVEQSQYYVNMLITDTERNMKERKRIFEKEISKDAYKNLYIDKLNLEKTEIPEKQIVSNYVDSVRSNIESLLSLSVNIQAQRGMLTKKFQNTVKDFEQKVVQLQILISEKDTTLKQILQREENTVNALGLALESAIIHERNLIQKYKLPVEEYRLTPIVKTTNNLSGIVKDRWKNHHNLQEIADSLRDESDDSFSNKLKEDLQHTLHIEHEKHVLELNKKIDDFQTEYSGLLSQYKQLQLRLAFYENDKQYMKQFRGPTGRVTIVFTDVEGSTALWENCEEAMTKSISIHNQVIRSLLEEFNGYEVKTEGDAFMCAFSNCIEAVDFALQIQNCLLECNWPVELLENELCKEIRGEDDTILWRGLRVRFGIHVGYPIVSQDPTSHRDDYFGPVVNMASRVEGYADGGGVCISSAVWKEIESFIGNMRTKFWVTFIGPKPLKGMKDDELRILVPAQLRGRKFNDSNKEARWEPELSWKPLAVQQQLLENKINSMKSDFSQSLKASSLQSIVEEKDVVIRFLLSQLKSDVDPIAISNVMSQFSEKINIQVEELENASKDRVESISLNHFIQPKKTHIGKFSVNLSPNDLNRPEIIKSSESKERKKKKKKNRSSSLKPVEIKSNTIEVSKDEYNMLQHNVKFLKEQRDQAVKKQKNLAMALLECQTKLHHVTKDVMRYKKQIKVGGSFGIAAPDVDLKDLEKPKLIKTDNFEDENKKKKRKHKRSRSVSPFKSSFQLPDQEDSELYNLNTPENFGYGYNFELSVDVDESNLSSNNSEIAMTDSSSESFFGSNNLSKDSGNSIKMIHQFSFLDTSSEMDLNSNKILNNINSENTTTIYPNIISESLSSESNSNPPESANSISITIDQDINQLPQESEENREKRSKYEKVKPRFLDHFSEKQREYEKARERVKQKANKNKKWTALPSISAKVTPIELNMDKIFES